MLQGMLQGVSLAAALVLAGVAVASAEQTAAAAANGGVRPPVEGVPLPNWTISNICAEESAPSICADLEARARNAVAAGWPFLLDDMKRACLDEVRLPADRSWRLLAECMIALELIDRRFLGAGARERGGVIE